MTVDTDPLKEGSISDHGLQQIESMMTMNPIHQIYRLQSEGRV